MPLFQPLLMLQLLFWGSDQAVEDLAFVALALVNVVWGSVWLEAWKRRSAGLVHRWGLPADSQELLQEPRPQYKVGKGASLSSFHGWTL